MKKVIVFIPEKQPPNVFKFKVAAATKGSNFKEYITREIVELMDVDFFLICNEKEKKPCFLDESKPFSAISEASKLSFRLVVRYQNISLRTSISEQKTVQLDMKEICSKNIASLQIPKPEFYVFSFRVKGTNVTRLAANGLQLVFQGWKGEELTLHKRLSISDNRDKSVENLRVLFDTCRMYVIDGIVYFQKNNWGVAAAYLYIAEGRQHAEFKKAVMAKLLPPNIPSNDLIFQTAKNTIIQNITLSPKNSAEKFVEHFLMKGSLCCHAEQVKFLLVEKKWHMQSSRWIFVSMERLVITKDYAGEVVYAESLSGIDSIESDDEHVYINLKSGKQWKLRPENPTILSQIILDVRTLYLTINPKERCPSMAISELIEITETNTTNNEEEVINITNETEDLCSESNDFLFSGDFRRSRFNDAIVVPGISQLITPSPIEENGPYSIADQYYRNLQIVEKLTLPERQPEEEHSEVPDISEIFTFPSISVFSNDNPRHKIIALSVVLLLVIIFFIKNL